MKSEIALSISKSFLKAHDRCAAERFGEGLVSNAELIPAIVCIAFSIEIGLKAVLISEGKQVSGHKFQPLFDSISEGRRELIARNTGYEATRFQSELCKANNAFVEWRYIYEMDGDRSVSAQFLMLFAHAIHKVADQRGEA